MRRRAVSWCLVCFGLLTAVLALSSCGPRAGTGAGDKASKTVLKDAPRRAGLPAIAVFLPPSPPTLEVWTTLKEEVGEEYDVVTHSLNKDSAPEDFKQELARVRPACVVLIGNRALNLYAKYQARNPGPFPPAIVVMASFLDEQRSLLRNATGIAYEVPGITTFVKLRSFVDRPVGRVGVVHRDVLGHYVHKQAELAKIERVEVVTTAVDRHPSANELRGAVRKLIYEDQVDALWVLNDNVLLQPDFISDVWLEELHKHPVIAIVGASTLVDAEVHFGAFAMLPDHSALGVQTANLVFKLADVGWDAAAEPVELPLSVETVVDLTWMKEHFSFKAGALDRIDRVVQ